MKWVKCQHDDDGPPFGRRPKSLGCPRCPRAYSGRTVALAPLVTAVGLRSGVPRALVSGLPVAATAAGIEGGSRFEPLAWQPRR